MKYSFVDTHILAFIKIWEASPLPLDLALSKYFKAHKSLGANDRRNMGETIYSLIRWKSLLDWFDPNCSYPKRLQLISHLHAWRQDPSIPEYARLGLSPYLFQKFVDSFGLDHTRELAAALSSPPPISIRVNTLKTDRETLYQQLSSRFAVSRSNTPNALRFAKREPLFALPEFKQGLFEVQDEGSQEVARLVDAKAGQRVLDYCSGSGGKTLSIAPNMDGKGELYLHDIREKSLQEAVKRLRRAGIQNAQILPPGHPTLKKLEKKMDWVLVDVPCSGTGTLRRNPEMKWKIDAPLIERLQDAQVKIFLSALKFLKPEGKIVYATCSILPEENQHQVERFLAECPLVLDREPLQFLPQTDGPDGFFGAVFKLIKK